MSWALVNPIDRPNMTKCKSVKSKLQMIARIDNLLARNVEFTAWEKEFLTSIKQGVQRYGSLTGKQESILQRIETSKDPAVVAQRQSWKANYNSDMRSNMKIAGQYYLNNPPYFADLARRALDDNDFIPTEKQYRAMVDNKYVQKVLDNMNSVPTFAVGTMAQLRQTAPTPGRKHYNKMVMIIDYPDKVAGAAKGAVPVTVLPVGSSEVFETEVRWLKKARG
tara:strand:+ start:145 stop:810 length:666 start_codon:yes stop_codon:yes gene_type:complete